MRNHDSEQPLVILTWTRWLLTHREGITVAESLMLGQEPESRTYVCIDACMDACTCACLFAYGCMDAWMAGWLAGWMGGWAVEVGRGGEGRAGRDGWMDGWVDGWVDGWMDGGWMA